MSMDGGAVHALLKTVADSEAPATTVDIGRAAATGRRNARLRQAAIACAAALTALVIVAGAGLMIGSRPERTSPPLEVAAPASFETLVQYAEFGWLPDGLTDRTTRTEPDVQRLVASATSKTGVDARMVELAAVPAGHTIELEGGSDADPVLGRPARWGVVEGGTALQWQYAPGAWASVTVWDATDPRAVARHVAESARFGVNRAIRLPVRATGLPQPFQLASVVVSQSTATGGWSAELGYSDTGKRTDLGDWPLSMLALNSSMRTGDGGTVGDPNTTLDGHPARRTDGADGGKGLQVFDVDGVYLELATHAPATTGRLPGGLDGLFRGLQVARDPAGWF
ncbi:hypothetical protein [Dactylosporangium darangshiense]